MNLDGFCVGGTFQNKSSFVWPFVVKVCYAKTYEFISVQFLQKPQHENRIKKQTYS
jgi:hypothetical protein